MEHDACGIGFVANLKGKKSHENVQDAYELRIESHNNELECRASITVHELENCIAPNELISLLKKLKITDALDLESVAIFCTEAAQGDDVFQKVITSLGVIVLNIERGPG